MRLKKKSSSQKNWATLEVVEHVGMMHEKMSGLEFREKVLIPFINVLRGSNVVIDLDGAYGYVRSFLIPAFENLMQDINSTFKDNFLIMIKCADEPSLEKEVKELILKDSHRKDQRKVVLKFFSGKN